MQPDARPRPDKLIAFVLPDLRAGGVERITIALLGEFLRRGYRVDLVLGQQRGELLGLVPAGVRVFSLGESRMRRMILPLRRYLKSERPDAMRAAMWSLTGVAILAAAGLSPRPRVVLSEHNPLELEYGGSGLRALGFGLAIRATHRFADGLVAVSGGVADQVARLTGLPRARIVTIFNPVAPPACSPAGASTAWAGARGKRILSVGRLEAQKNHQLLIEAFAALSNECEATLAIIGEGGLRPALEAQARALGVAERVLLPGFSATPGDWYAGADLFVLSSDFEGFGNVLVEALHHGLPIVSTDCPGGPREILGGGRWGRLVPVGDKAALAVAMTAALDAAPDAAGQRARAADFALSHAADAYEALLMGGKPTC